MRSVYLDNSATTYPKPESVQAAVTRSMNQLGANPGRSGYAMATATSDAVYQVRKKAAAFFGAQGPEKVVFTKNCTEALNIVIQGKLKPGDHVVVSDLEHNAVMRPVKAMEKRGVSCTVFETFPGDNDRTLQSLKAALRENTRLVVCTSASNVFGVRLPIARLGALCHIYDIEFCVDAAQGAGIIPINMQTMSIDYLCVPSHKGLYGIMGAGMLIAEKDLDPLMFGGTGTNSHQYTQPDDLPERLESGTINVPGIISIGSGIDFVTSKSVERIHQTEIGKAQMLYSGLKKNKAVILYTPYPVREFFVPVLSFNIQDKGSEEVGAALAARGVAVRCGLHCAPAAHNKFGTTGGTVRVSPSVFTTPDGINYFLRQINTMK